MTAIPFLLVILLIALGVLAIRSHFFKFRGQRPEDYRGIGPDFDLKTHLNGSLVCEGIIFGPTGRLSSRFVAQMTGTWDGDTGRLEEEFSYDSGSHQSRAWDLAIKGPGRFTADADDIIGQGEGRYEGAGVQLRYTIVLPKDAGGHALKVTDWMYLLDNGTIVNRSEFRKFGIKVAELVATIRREDSA